MKNCVTISTGNLSVGDSCHTIENYPLNESYKPHDDEWLQKARDLISHSDIVIVVLGLSRSFMSVNVHIYGKIGEGLML